MPIDSTDDIETVEAKIESGFEKGENIDENEGGAEDGDSNLSPEELDFDNGLIDGDDGEPWDEGDMGGESWDDGETWGDSVQSEMTDIADVLLGRKDAN